MRKKREIMDMSDIVSDKYYYGILKSDATTTFPGEKDSEQIKRNAQDIRSCKKFLKEVEKKYGKKNLALKDTFEFEKLQGWFEVLQWVLGYVPKNINKQK